MDKYIYDNNNGLWYELIGDYYIPCLTLPTEEEKPGHIAINPLFSSVLEDFIKTLWGVINTYEIKSLQSEVVEV